MHDSPERQRIKEQEWGALHAFATERADARFWISWLEEQGFCEYKLCLKLSTQGWVTSPDPDIITNGIKTHAQIEQAHNAIAEQFESIEDIMAEAVSGNTVSTAEVPIRGDILSGKVDGLILSKDNTGADIAYLIDNKTPPRTKGREPFYSHRRQALGYAVAWVQSNPYYLHCGHTFAVIRNKFHQPREDLSGGWLWKTALTPEAIRDITETIDWVRTILTNPLLARDTPYKATKCPQCDFHKTQVCDRDSQ